MGIMINQQLTIDLKILASALGCLDRHNLSEIITLGGIACSKSRADAILRGSGAVKNATGNSNMQGTKINRSATVTPDEFHAFCVGLKIWLESLETKE
ncbi:hypothetical protein KIN91_000709 [Salmonella enterica subsp. enterica serovar Durban]|uniref:Uncharacterized protein n=6 Tax=Salmonella enterica TaxID=28901 RepID=A0A6C7CVD3_SALER|nr:hypothetical protein DOE57_06500 [Salmonella enterica subsp. salamae serovar 56:b:[1,5]]EAA6224106.1 hypothetical protein [Salmonella enterica subsp. salamae]EAM3923891.1 hypothetical protein [Salmonella enterica]EBP3808971.1 hypothetical protein [Salmonella enterica subsp. enterica]ECG1421857.1 hypothetical protein [Salmonella enterica subsp. salamae str. CFSAN000559]EDX4960661.1 hypothetical protein [Salmonella enterica subsp. salamae serovar 58:l,z13,z28:z6]EHN2590182.1 hypothetical pro